MATHVFLRGSFPREPKRQGSELKQADKMPSAQPAVSGVILAGGLSTRFFGRNKAFLEVGGRRIIDHLYGLFRPMFDEIIIVTNHPWLYLEFDAHLASDIFPVRSSLTGIHAGLFYAGNPFIFAAACDTPFLEEPLVRSILARIKPHAGIVIPETAKGLEPLCAVYAKPCLPVMERRIRSERFKIQGLFKSLPVVRVPEEELREADPDLRSFYNVNTPSDLAKAQSLLDSSV
jgi:molybdopterin-guanine dinucleotide biosynthesis protein A